VAFDLVVSGGTVVTAERSRRADVGITGERIAAVEDRISAAVAGRVIDATGLLVLPGVVDVHTHTRIATDDEPDRFFQDSVAAAYGGTTTFLSFDNPGTGISEAGQASLIVGIHEWLARTHADSAIDYGLSAVVTSAQRDPIGDLPAAVAVGVPTFKAFMVYEFGLDETELFRLLAEVDRAGGMLELHCEDRASMQRRIDELLTTGRRTPRYHAESRPAAVEAAGTARARQLAARADAPFYAVHLSSVEALQEIRAARQRGQRAWAETCPHYLVLDERVYDGTDADAARYIISPPLRHPAQRESLWAAVANGGIDVIATDHVPDRAAQEKLYVGQPFTEISNGAPGIETLLTLIYSKGVAGGRITASRMVEVLSTTPARLFGLPRKGAVEVGRDADLVLFDPSARRVIRASDLHHTSDYTPYEGMDVTGAVRTVLLRGREVILDGRFVGTRGQGRFMERALV
jgi:dihydropyrimidinase